MTIAPRAANAGRRLATVVGGLLLCSVAGQALAVSDRSQDFLNDAGKRLEHGDVNAAIVQLKNALQQDPNNYLARALLGRIYLRQGAFDAAEKELRRALEGSPGDENRLALGQALLGLGRNAEVIEIVKVDSTDPSLQKQALLLRAEALLNAGRPDDAKTALDEILKSEPLQPEANLLSARMAAARGDFEGARTKLDLSLTSRPDWPAARLFKVQLALNTGSLDAAMAAVDEAEKAAPGNPAFALMRAQILYRQGRLDEAERAVDSILARSPDAVDASFLKASIEAVRGNPGEADRLLRQIGDRLRDYPPALLLTGLVKAQLGQNALAEQQFGRYLTLVPGDRSARRRLAELQLLRGDARGAVDTLGPVTGPTSQDLPSLQLLSSAQLHAGDLAGAGSTLNRIVAIGQAPFAGQARGLADILRRQPADGPPVARLMDVALTLDELRLAHLDGALARATALVQQYPEDPEILNLAGGIHLLRDENTPARELFNRAVALNAGFGPALDNLNRVDIREDHVAAAEARLRDRLTKNPGDEALALALAGLLVYDGRQTEAEEFLQDQGKLLPRSVALRSALGDLYAKRSQTEQVRSIAEQLAALAQDGVAGAALASASLFVNVGLNDRALEVLTKETQRPSATADASLFLVRLQYAQGRRDDARSTLVALQDRFPSDLVVSTSLVDLDLRAGRTEQALETARKAAAVDAVQGAILEANVLIQANRSDDAIAGLSRVLETTQSPLVARELFRTRWRADQKDAAIDGLRGWLAKNPDDALNYGTLSEGYVARHDEAAAYTLLERAVQLVPADPQILNNLAWLRFELGRPDALTLAKRAHTLAPEAPEITDTLGWLLVRSGKVDEGLALLREAESKMKDNSDVRYHLAFGLDASGQRDDARRILEELMASNAEFGERPNAQKLLTKLQGS